MNPLHFSAPTDEPAQEWKWPTDLRKFMCWIFLATSLQYLTLSLRSIPYANHQRDALPLLYRLLTAPVISIVMAAFSGAAWWTIWKEKSLAKGLAIGASVIYVLIFLRQFIIPLPVSWDHRVGALLIGIVGLFAFLWPDKKADT